MTSLPNLIFSGAAGFGLGVIFFGGLWWTVQRGVHSPRPVVWFAGSLVLRMSTVVFGFYLVGANDLKRLAACLIGFILARVAVMRFTRASAETQKEVHDAP